MAKKEKTEKKIKGLKNSKNNKRVETVKGIFAKKQKCKHTGFWTLYRIINFHRGSLQGVCGTCYKEIQIQYIAHDTIAKNIYLRIFSCILWMSPALLIILLASILSPFYGLGVYVVAIVSVILFHFWAMYYIIRGGSLEIK